MVVVMADMVHVVWKVVVILTAVVIQCMIDVRLTLEVTEDAIWVDLDQCVDLIPTPGKKIDIFKVFQNYQFFILFQDVIHMLET